jgi:hypothetical protein
VVLQLIMVAIVIVWPGLVTFMLDKPSGIDPNTIKIELPQTEFQQDQEKSEKEGESEAPPDFSTPQKK